MHVLSIAYPQIDPIALKLGPVVVRWYGLSYVAGLLLGWLYIRHLVSTPRLWGGTPPLNRDQTDSLLLWITAGVVVGGRLGAILLYDPLPYLRDPLEIFAVWHGGMAFHGGLIGVVLATFWFARRHGVSVLSVGDVVTAAVPIGLFFGRIANFINGELWGRTTMLPWGMVFPDREAGLLPRHPSQLYEAGLEGVLLFAVLWWLVHRGLKLQQPGYVAGAFLLGYGLARSFCELFREGDGTWFLGTDVVTAGMLYSLPMIAIGAWMMWRARAKVTAARPA